MSRPRLGTLLWCASAVVLSLVTVPTAETTSRAASMTSPGRSPGTEIDRIDAPTAVQPPGIRVDEGDDDPHVRSVTTGSDGITRVVEYTPAQGVDAGALYTTLKAAGVSGLVRPRAEAVSAGCSYAHLGGARTLCPILHWANNGYTRPQVYFADHTSGNWPVQSTTRNWNNSQRLDTHYVSTCPSGVHCVNMWSDNYGNTCWQGISSWSYDGNRNFIDGSVSIWLNEFNGRGGCGNRTINYAKSAAGYQQDACHEQGHTLGLDHNADWHSCLYADIINSYYSVYPDADDYSLLNWIYASVH